jgi:prepilin-type N-terminal cleavage/methylation domain-containing protein
MTRPLPATRAPRGFTLVEVMVGALVLGIFVSFVYGAVVSAFQVRSVVQTTTSAMATGTMAIEIVARDLENTFHRPIDGENPFKAEEDGGERSRVVFLTTTDSRSQLEIDRVLVRSDVCEVGYRTRQVEGGLALYRREDFAVDGKPLEGGDWFKVAAGVREFRLEWFEKRPSEMEEGDEEEGVPTWDAKAKSKLPRAAKVTLVLEGLSSDPARADELATYRFTRWVLLPGADDASPTTEAPPAQGPP